MTSIALISNITLEPYFLSQLQESFQESSEDIEFHRIAFNEYKEYADILELVDYVAICLHFEDFYPNSIQDMLAKRITTTELFEDILHRCKELQWFLDEKTNAYRLWFGFEDESYKQKGIEGSTPLLDMVVDRMNVALFDMMHKRDVYLDLRHIIGKIGYKQAFDDKGRYRWNAPYSKETMQAMAAEIYKQFVISTGKTRKCLIVDCDNVLWGGILSEDGIEKLHLAEFGLGRKYTDFQRFLVSLYYHGVILAICSKNDEKDVLQVFREHGGMILKEEQIACFQCNWDNKPDNIKAIAKFLNIGLDSIVFIDDMDFEIGMVQAMLPEVISIKFDLHYPENLTPYFNQKYLGNNEDIDRRIKTYRTNREREELYRCAVNREEYLRELKTKIEIHDIMPAELARVAELTQRANQCTNGKRYTIEKLKKIYTDHNFRLYSVLVSDCFSNLGVVGAIGIDDDRVLDLFVLSCRAMGRDVENTMIEYVKSLGIREMFFESTGKNEALRKLLSIDLG